MKGPDPAAHVADNAALRSSEIESTPSTRVIRETAMPCFHLAAASRLAAFRLISFPSADVRSTQGPEIE